MEWRRTVELSEGMVQRANEPECYGKESQVGAKDIRGIEMRCKGIALEARMSNGITRQFIDASGQAKEMKCGGYQKIKTKRRKQHVGNQSKINIHRGNSWNSGGR